MTRVLVRLSVKLQPFTFPNQSAPTRPMAKLESGYTINLSTGTFCLSNKLGRRLAGGLT
jgi:hypothetical protein